MLFMMILLTFSLALFLVPIVDRVIPHMALIHETEALRNSALVPHVFPIVVSVAHVDLAFTQMISILTTQGLSRDALTGHIFPVVVLVLCVQMIMCKEL